MMFKRRRIGDAAFSAPGLRVGRCMDVSSVDGHLPDDVATHIAGV